MTGTLGVVFGLIVIVVTVVLLVKRVETRAVLIGAGFVMTIAALAPMKAFDAFSTRMTAGSFIQTICSTLGFALVLQYTSCDKHLIHSLAKLLSKVRPLLIPGVVLATFCVNIALVSAAGCSAAVGVIMIPLLISQGVHPAVAASAVMLGTFGSNLSPGNPHNANIAELANMSILEVIKAHSFAMILCIIVAAGWLSFYAKIKGENKGFKSDEYEPVEGNFKVNPILAILPLVPIAMLILFTFPSIQEQIKWAASFKVPHAMILGSFLCMVFTRSNPQEVTKKFFDGMGKAYGDVLGIIIAAAVFVAGMDALGMINAFIEMMKNSDHIVKLASTYGPFLLGVVSGSGDAATLAFNGAVTPHAESFGVAINKMGSVAAIAGSLGRTMSPLAGAAIICAGIAKVNPFEIAKRNGPAMILATIVLMVTLFYF